MDGWRALKSDSHISSNPFKNEQRRTLVKLKLRLVLDFDYKAKAKVYQKAVYSIDSHYISAI
jgi:hypothetical protein